MSAIRFNIVVTPCWRAVSSHSSHHSQEVLLAPFSHHVHKVGHSFHLSGHDISVLFMSAILGLYILHYLVHTYTAVQSQKAVSAYFTSKQILPLGFAEQYSCCNSTFMPRTFIRYRSINLYKEHYFHLK